ncbi:MAG: PA0069 family radical SAM protein [Gammaproteobacteria bacterium]|nr:PA0069 family radical SAM protein [Gammaproteobacteria bacterium]
MDTGSISRNKAVKGRGTVSNPEGRFERLTRDPYDDGWTVEEDIPPLKTTVRIEQCRSIITRNDSPDIPFEQSINPYRGCEHGCVYCYARPSHAYVGLSSGLDFETRLFAKTNAAKCLRAELAQPGYRCRSIALGTNTDPYQPIERRYRVMREILEVLAECRHPLSIVTKSALIERDLDLLAPMARERLVHVFLSITTLDRELARRLEPRAAAPARRLEAVQRLTAVGVPVGVMVAPVIPGLTCHHMENILEASHAAGACSAGYVLLRLPHEVKNLFREWLTRHAPLKAEHVMSLVRNTRGGRDNDPRFGSHLRASGSLADLIEDRFAVACRRLGFNLEERTQAHDRFRSPADRSQLPLF